MRAELELDVPEPDKLRDAVGPSLRSSEKVGFEVRSPGDLEITVEADRLGPLRGGTNTALMLVRLATRTLER